MVRALYSSVALFALAGATLGNGAPSTVFLRLRPVNCPEETAARIDTAVRARLKKLAHCDPVPDRKAERAADRAGAPACRDAACAVKIARLAGARYAIYGTVTRRLVTYDRPLDRKGAGKYLLGEQEKEVISVTLALADAEHGAVIATITDAPERAAARLQPFFPPPKKEDTKGGEKTDRKADAPTASLHIAPAFFLPVGSFRSVARAGVGFDLGVTFSHPATGGGRLMALAGYRCVFVDRKNIESYHLLPFSIFAGYEFDLPKNFSVSPLVGGGYLIHLLSRDTARIRIPGVYSYSGRVFADPHLTVRFEAGWRHDMHIAVFAAPLFTLFFEKGTTGMYPGFDAGFRYTF